MRRYVLFVIFIFTLLVSNSSLFIPVQAGKEVIKSKCQYPGTKGKVEQYYTGRLIDTHLHIPPPTDSGNENPVLRKDMNLDDIACTLQYEGTRSAFSFFPVYVNDADYEPFYKAADNAKKKYPKRFVRFINPPGGTSGVPTVTAKELKRFLKDRPGLFQGYGEIGLYVTPENPENVFPPDAQIFQKIYPVVRKHKMLVYFHPGEDQLDHLATALAQNPDINFVVHGEQVEKEIGTLMDSYTNIYFTVNDLYGDQYLLHQGETKESFLEKIDDYETLLAQDIATWKDVIEAHPNQFMWGTDRGGIAAWTLHKDVGLGIADYGRAFIAQLDPAVQEKFAYKNAQRLINGTILFEK
ncbi:MAG: amidohydrolase family protein [Candidatus Kerfeldbacteria bacterium]|nr:amidohydrolase family protein [Candidatus Kerfeldbacteria bacterium]